MKYFLFLFFISSIGYGQTSYLPISPNGKSAATQTFTQLGTMVYFPGAINGGTTNTGGTLNDGKIDISSIGATGIIVAIITAYNVNIGAVTFADNVGNSYTTVRTQAASGGTTDFSRIYVCINPTNLSSALTFTVGGSVTASAVAASAWRTTITPIVDQQNSAILTQPGSITPTVSGELLVSGGSNQSATTAVNSGFATPVQWPFVGGVAYGGGFSWQVQSVAAAINPTWTNGNTSIIVSIK